jgi:hypothetical protein
MATVGLTEVLAALSLATDLGSGFAPEKGLRTCLVALAVGHQAGVDDRELSDVFQGALLEALGCTAYATVNAWHFDDDLSFQRELHGLDVSDPASLASFGSWAGEKRGAELRAHFREDRRHGRAPGDPVVVRGVPGARDQPGTEAQRDRGA